MTTREERTSRRISPESVPHSADEELLQLLLQLLLLRRHRLRAIESAAAVGK